MSVFVNYPPAGGNYPPGTVLIPLSDLGLDQILSQIRSQDFNPDVLRELEDSIAKNGLLEALGVIPTRPGSSNVKPVTVVHGVHRLGRIINLAATLGLFANGVPCLPESYASLGDLYIKQFNKNAHDEKVHTPNGKDDAISLIGKILQDGTLAPMGGLTWSTSTRSSGRTTLLQSTDPRPPPPLPSHPDGVGWRGAGSRPFPDPRGPGSPCSETSP